MVTSGAAPLIVYAFGRVRRRTSTDAFQTCNAGRAGAYRPSEALQPTRSSDVLPRIAREHVPTALHVAKTHRNMQRRIARERVPNAQSGAERFSTCRLLECLSSSV